MKKLIYTAFVICGMLTASCSDLLNLESKTDESKIYLFTTPEGLNTAVTGLYSLARELPGGADNNESNLYIVTMCDFNTDIAILRAGVSTSIGRLNTSFTPSTGDVNKFWKHHYGIIGKANEIIVAAEALGLDDSDVLHAWSEAKFFRGRSYFELWKRFDRLYLNITPSTFDNLKREYIRRYLARENSYAYAKNIESTWHINLETLKLEVRFPAIVLSSGEYLLDWLPYLERIT